jgi:CheY-like chemotaxis protein
MILVIDDNPKRVQMDVEELEHRAFEVMLVDNVDEAIARLRESIAGIEAVVCDIMMPPGTLGGDRTRDGLRSGLSIVNTIRQLSEKLPIIVFTNVAKEDLGSNLLSGKHIAYLYKPDCLPRVFAERVVRFLEEEKEGPNGRCSGGGKS